MRALLILALAAMIALPIGAGDSSERERKKKRRDIPSTVIIIRTQTRKTSGISMIFRVGIAAPYPVGHSSGAWQWIVPTPDPRGE